MRRKTDPFALPLLILSFPSVRRRLRPCVATVASCCFLDPTSLWPVFLLRRWGSLNPATAGVVARVTASNCSYSAEQVGSTVVARVIRDHLCVVIASKSSFSGGDVYGVPARASEVVYS